MKTQPIFRNLISDLRFPHVQFAAFRRGIPSTFVNCLFVWVMLAIAIPQDSAAQSLASIKSAEKAVEKAQEKVDKAQEEVKKAQKAVDDEIEKMKKEAEDNPKAHGTNSKLTELRKEQQEAEEALKKAKEVLEKAKERLKKAKEKFEEQQKKALEEALKQRPLPKDKKGLEDYKRELESWKNGVWGTGEGEDLKKRIREKIDEELRKLEGNEQSSVPERGMHETSEHDRYLVELAGMLSLGNLIPHTVEMPELQAAVFNPGTIEQLFEQLGGEFILGASTGQILSDIELQGQTNLMPGIGFGIRLGSGLELGLRGNYFKSKWSGAFPVTVFPFQASEAPHTFQGSINASLSGLLTDLEARYFLTSGSLRPYVQVGARGQWLLNSNSSADISGVILPLESPSLSGNTLSVYAGAGIRMNVGQSAFVQSGISYAHVPGSGYTPTMTVGVGLRFGEDNVDCNKKEDLPALIRRLYDMYTVYRQGGDSHEEAMKKVMSENLQEDWKDIFKKIYDKQTKKK